MEAKNNDDAQPSNSNNQRRSALDILDEISGKARGKHPSRSALDILDEISGKARRMYPPPPPHPYWFICEKQWTWSTLQQALPKDASKLNDPSCISDGFQEKLGISKHIDLTSKSGEMIRVCLFAALVEAASSQKYLAESHGEAIRLLTFGARVRGFVQLRYPAEVCWGIHTPGIKSGSWLDMSQDLLGLSRLDALATMAAVSNMDISNVW